MKISATYLKLLFLLICSLLHFESYGQKEANNWYFGYGAGINFNYNPPRAVYGGQTQSSIGNAAMSDANGNLLFYASYDNGIGVGIWNQNHQQMANSNGYSPTWTNTLIIPWPGQPHKYFLFSSALFTTPPNRNYTIVDMALNNGLGGVTTLNIPFADFTFSDFVAVKHRNNRDFWLISQTDSLHKFEAYLISTAGLNLTPVVSMIPGSSRTSTDIRIKASPDGKTLAFTDITSTSNGIQLLNFDAATGIITNKGNIADNNSSSGIEFSPDGTKLYCIRSKLGVTGASRLPDLMQYDLDAGTITDITNSATLIYHFQQQHHSILTMQVGPDGKIYMATHQNEFLNVIHRPNLKGTACQFRYGGFDLDPQNVGQMFSGLFLPTFIQSYFYRPKITMQQTCFGDTARFTLSNPAYVDSVEWNFGDPASGVQNTSTLFNPKHFYATPGPKQVQAIVHFNLTSDTLTQTIYIPTSIVKPNLGNDTTLCAGDTLILNAYQPGARYEWQDSINTDSVYVVTRPGTYWVQVSNGCGTLGDSITVNFAQPLSFSLPEDTVLCPGQTLTLQVNPQGANLLWNDSTSASTFTVSQPGTYWAQLSNACGSWRDSITVNYRPDVTNNWLPKDTILCSISPFEINGETPAALSYKWQDGSTFSSFTATVSGTYWLEITTECTTVRDSIQVTINKLPETRFADTTICTGDSFVLTAPKALSYRWSTGDSTQSITINQAGNYKVALKTVPGCFFSDFVTVQTGRCFKTAFIPNIITPNNDGFNDLFEPKGLEAGQYELSIYNRWGTLIYRNENYTNQWPDKKLSDGTYYYFLQNKQTGKTYKGWVEIAQ